MGNIKLYRLQKRHNSTLQPTGTGTDTSVALKGGSDIITPTFTMHHNTFPNYNYVKYNGRYYFVNKIKAVRDDLFDIECEVDVLATYKASIQAASAYVLYYTHANSEIADKRLSTKTTKSLSIETGNFDILGNGTGTNYAVALNVIGVDACDTFIVSQATAREILNDYDNWFDNTGSYTSDGSGIEDINDPIFSWASVEDAIKSFLQETIYFWKQWFASGKLSDNLRSAFMLPLPVSAIGGYTENIRLGQYKSSKTGTRVNDRIFSDGADVTIPWQGITDWRRNAPYMELFLYIPYIGLITLSPSDLVGENSLHVSVSIDITCGDAVFTVYTGTNRYIGQYTTNMAAAFAVGTSNISTAAMFNTLGSVAASVAASGASGGSTGIVDLASGSVAKFGNVLAGMPTCIGSNAGGAVLGLTDKIVCYSIFHDTTAAPSSVSAISGTPFNGVMALSGISGYVQTQGASVAEATADPVMVDYERNLINQMLDGGIYIE